MTKTIIDEFAELQETMFDLLYALAKAYGIVWLAKRIPFLELRDWVKKREK